jgi:6-phosphogluconate dehydrogenase
MGRCQIGVIGLAVMGKNLALNMAEKGFSVAVYNRSREKTDELVAEAAGMGITGAYTLQDFCGLLKRPRRVMLMVKAGQAVDDTIGLLKPYLDAGDVIIDGGNSYFKDTIRRNRMLATEGFRFIGTGVSGGEEGARHGPAIMPGGQEDAYRLVEPILTAISAHVDGDACCTYIGADGAGHYVKMVHNGIEYADMQLIGEAYYLLKNLLGMDTDELYKTFDAWNGGELDSYLIEITRNIFPQKDPETGLPMVNVILDAAGQKGTGKWTSQESLDLGLPAPTIAEAVFARCMSAGKAERVKASKAFTGPERKFTGDRAAFIEAVRRALYASKICAYAQGFALLKAAAAEYGWKLDYSAISMIFRGGCIIRARFLHRIKDAYDANPCLDNLLLDSYFRDVVQSYQQSWREVVIAAARAGVAVPAFSSALAYFDAYRDASSPANLIQAQRDYFGAHTFRRVDREGVFHHQWF